MATKCRPTHKQHRSVVCTAECAVTVPTPCSPTLYWQPCRHRILHSQNTVKATQTYEQAVRYVQGHTLSTTQRLHPLPFLPGMWSRT